MTKQRMKDIQAQLHEEVKMTTRQAALIKQLYTERDNLLDRTEVLNEENKLLLAQCTEWKKLALNLMIKLTNTRADLIVQQSTK